MNQHISALNTRPGSDPFVGRIVNTLQIKVCNGRGGLGGAYANGTDGKTSTRGLEGEVVPGGVGVRGDEGSGCGKEEGR